MPSFLSTMISHRETKIWGWGSLIWICYKCYLEHVIKQGLCGKSISGKDEPEERQVYKLAGGTREYQSMYQAEVAPWPVQSLLGQHRCTPGQSPASVQSSLLSESRLPFPSQPCPCKFSQHYSSQLFCCWLLKWKPFMMYISQRWHN